MASAAAAKKCPRAGPVLVLRTGEPQPGFVNEGGGLKCLARGFVRHFARGELAQFVVNQRQQLRRGTRITGLGGIQDFLDVSHGPEPESKISPIPIFA
jgi:hypothetical protein